MNPITLRSLISGLGFLVLSSLGAASCGGDDGGTSDLVAACEKFCSAQAVPMCTKGLEESSCISQCGAAPVTFGKSCTAEWTAALDCFSTLEFTCMMDTPAPKVAGCLSENQALQTCQQDAPCKGFCAAAVGAGCGGASEAACVTACKDEIAKDDFCGFQLRDYRSCEGTSTLTCSSGKPTTTSCEQEKIDYADCVSFDDPCRAFCFLADEGGCAGGAIDACVTACTTELDSSPNCSSSDRQYLECAARDGITCTGSKPSAPSCSSEKSSYDMCKMQNP